MEVQPSISPGIYEKFFEACRKPDYDAVNSLLSEYNLDLNCHDKDFKTPLALVVPNLKLISLFLTKQIDPNVYEIIHKDEWSSSILQHVILNIKDSKILEQLIKLLISHGSSILLANTNHQSPLVSYILENTLKNACQLPEKFSYPKKFYQLCRCIDKDDYQEAETLLNFIDDIDFKLHREITPLRFAVIRNRYKFVKIFLEKGANVNARESPLLPSILYTAVQLNQKFAEDIVELLIRHGADANRLETGVSGHFFNTAFLLATTAKRLNLLRVLLRYNADIDSRDSCGLTALHKSCMKGEEDCVELLLRQNASPNVQAPDGTSPLFWAATLWSKTEILKKLLAYGARPNLDEWTLHMACAGSDENAVELLIRHGARLDFLGRHGENLLQMAAQNSKTSGPLKLLLENNIFKVNYKDKKGRTALFKINIESEQSICCENACLLLKSGAWLEVRDKNGEYPKLMANCNEKDDCPLVRHFRTLNLIDYRMTNTLIKKVFPADVSNIFYASKKIIMDIEYVYELMALKRIIVSLYPRRISLYDVLFAKENDLRKLARSRIINKLFCETQGNFEKKYRCYGFILNRIYQAAFVKKHSLIAIKQIFFNSFNIQLPEKIFRNIFLHLNQCDLILLEKVWLDAN